MPTLILDWLHLLLRWTHVVAAILWIGDSLLFMWMDSSLEAPSRPREGAVAGELWMVHSGGFYEVVKRRSLAPNELPRRLHWFKWQAYSTWISGIFLLGVVYWLGAGVYLVDRSVSSLPTIWAIAISAGTLAAGWLIYEALWRSPLGRRPALAATVGFALLVAAAWALCRVVTGHAAVRHVGAMLGTIMVANVKGVIIPAQNAMLEATRAGRPVDESLGARAKIRSTHNHYLTLPVLFTMLSGHFPATYGHPQAWLVLALLMVVGAAAKYVMNFGVHGRRWILPVGVAALIAVVALTARTPGAARAPERRSQGEAVDFTTARAILERRCVTCHATHPSNPSFAQPPAGVVLEDPRRIRSLAERIRVRAVVTRTMPLGNLTGMTEDERTALGAWIAAGAPIDSSTGR